MLTKNITRRLMEVLMRFTETLIFALIKLSEISANLREIP